MVDRAVGSIVEAVKRAGITENTAIIITGDHGFVDVHTSLQPNVWLTEAGMMNDIKRGDWNAQFQPAGGSAFLYLKEKEDKKILQTIEKILRLLPESQKKLFRVVDRDELDKIGADPKVSLALAGKKGVVFGHAVNGPAVRPVKGSTHGFFPDFPEIHTGFIGWGAGFNQGRSISFMGLEDIAPIIAKLLDIPFKAPDGVLHREVLEK